MNRQEIEQVLQEVQEDGIMEDSGHIFHADEFYDIQAVMWRGGCYRTPPKFEGG